jgi:LAS superfamily LD-carboxypeptidase LdcB
MLICQRGDKRRSPYERNNRHNPTIGLPKAKLNKATSTKLKNPLTLAIAESNNHKRRLAYYKYALARLKTKQGAVQEGEQLMEASLQDFKHLKIISGYDSTSVSRLLTEDDVSRLPSDVRFIAHPPS